MSKFLLNLRVQISKALVNSKNPIFNPKILFPIHFSLSAQLALPAHMAFFPASPTGLPSPQAEAFLAGPSGPCVDGVSVEMCFPFRFVPSKLVVFSLFSLCQVDPAYQSLLLPRAGQPQLCRHLHSPLPVAPSPRSASRDATSVP
jgi:hypothetical protein